jgi:broad specificity phosphatase PhoE
MMVIALKALAVPFFVVNSLSMNLDAKAPGVDTPFMNMPQMQRLNPHKEKTVYLIRHAESLENVAYKGARRVQASYSARKLPDPQDVGDAFKLAFRMFRPSVMNAALSEVGKKQVTQLHSSLEKDKFWEKLKKQEAATDHRLLLAHSPLVRAKQTAYGALLGPERMSPDATAEDVTDMYIEELPSLREVNPKEIIVDAVRIWKKKKTVDNRIKEFEEWLQSRPENTFVVVGHSVYFKRMLNLPKTFDNCDVWAATFDTSPNLEAKTRKVEGDRDNASELPRSWTSLRRLYRYTPDEIPEVDDE